ncbi:hypothetical protein Pelo_18746 [Pelomyxa schiedti]|nr:hypothetical protein Pelo_18746 [Pelomyxa schiedti]
MHPATGLVRKLLESCIQQPANAGMLYMQNRSSEIIQAIIVMIYIIIPSEEYVPTNVLVALRTFQNPLDYVALSEISLVMELLCHTVSTLGKGALRRRTLFKSDQLSAASISSATPRKWHLVASSENDTKVRSKPDLANASEAHQQAQGILEHSICTSKEQSAIAATFATFAMSKESSYGKEPYLGTIHACNSSKLKPGSTDFKEIIQSLQ